MTLHPWWFCSLRWEVCFQLNLQLCWLSTVAMTITNGSKSLVNSLFKFPIAAVEKYHKLNGLKQHKLSILQKSKTGLTGLKKEGVGISSGGLWKNLFSCLLEATYSPWLIALFSIFNGRSTASSNLTLTALLPSSLFKDSCDYTEPTWVIQDNLPNSK